MARGKRLSDEDMQQVIKLAKEGSTAAQIAKQVGCPIATIPNVKKAAGLVKARRGRRGGLARHAGIGTTFGNLLAERERLLMALPKVERKLAGMLRRQKATMRQLERKLKK